MVRDGKLYKRYEVKLGGKPPADFEAATEQDEVTGKTQGWVPVGDGPEDKWHREAWAQIVSQPDGTYELIGPKVQGNPEHYPIHKLYRHHADLLGIYPEPERTFEGIKAYLASHDIEGIVWHHPDGRMCKIKGRDFGIKRKPQP